MPILREIARIIRCEAAFYLAMGKNLQAVASDAMGAEQRKAYSKIV
jgi:hypothetical protein